MDFILSKLPLSYFKEMLDSGNPPVVAIDGLCGSGKTVFAKKFSNLIEKAGLDTQVVHLDYFIKESRYRLKYATVFDYDLRRIENEFLKPIKDNNIATFLLYDWDSDDYIESQTVYPDTVIVIEGVNSCDEKLKKYIDFSIFLNTTRDIRYQRVVKRGDFSDNEFLVWSLTEEEIFEDRNIEKYYDLVYNS